MCAVFVCDSLACFLSAVFDQGAAGFSEGGHGGEVSSSAGGMLSADTASISARISLNLSLLAPEGRVEGRRGEES